MPKFTLIGEHTDLYGNPNGTKVTYEFYADHIDNVLENVDTFIRGCGFYPIGNLEYFDDEFSDDIEHSDFYFDTERNK